MSSQFDLLAASLRADAEDMGVFVEALAVKLAESFPKRIQIERKGGHFGARPHVRHVAVSLGDKVYELESDAGEVSCRCRTVVRGIALRTEELSLEQWIDELAKGLVEESDKSESDREALSRMLTE